jgi:membrane-bound lytic murein transglycosylase A
MIKIITSIILFFLFLGCFKQEGVVSDFAPNLKLLESKIDKNRDFSEAFWHFKSNCKYKSIKKLYGDLCEKSLHVSDAKEFFLENFNYYEILNNQEDDKAILTGYYEPLLYGSRIKKSPYLYPLYNPPSDLLHVRLADAYEKLKNMRLRGKLINGEIVAYDDRESINKNENNLSAICYVSDRISRFFLEVQGSGRVKLDDGETIFVGYADQNGHAYTSIGKLLIENKIIDKDKISLQSIRKWLKENPQDIDKILNQNRSFVFFKQRSFSATGALGIELSSKLSVAVDKAFIPLGSILSIKSKSYSKMVFAEDTGGAIKGSVRADLFLGFGEDALKKAGALQDKLKLYIWIPKSFKAKIQS